MLLESSGVAAITPDIEARGYGFEMSAKLFSILTDKLYANKAGAVIQELSANARDAHRAAGTLDTPFDINLPTLLDPEFRIRDYGTGIPPDRFHEIYNSLGKSTKDTDAYAIVAYG